MNMTTMVQDMTLTKIDENLFDESKGYEDETGIRYAPGLTLEERHRATILYRLFNELWGVIVVKGDPGTGKDVFGNYLQYNLKKFFPHKRILRDEKPRALFGEYDGLFNENIIQSDLKNMREIAKGVKKEADVDKIIEKAADDWVTGAGEVMLKNSVLYLTEYWRYCYNREGQSPMNKTMGAIQKVKRHLDLLIIGTLQLTEELDKKTALPWIDWQVTCTRSSVNLTGFTYWVQRVKYDKRQEELVPLRSKPFPISFDAGKPRSNMGDGKILLKKPKYLPETEEERIVLEVIKAGATNYEEIVEFLEDEGDMSEFETLDTLKKLCLKLPGYKGKFVIWYPCYFFIYNSKSSPQLKSTVRISE